MRGVDLAWVAAARRANFAFLRSALGPHNRLRLEDSDQIPFCYPYLPPKPVDPKRPSRARLLHSVPVAQLERRTQMGFDFERRFSAKLLPLPIDHRYQPDDLRGLVKNLLERT